MEQEAILNSLRGLLQSTEFWVAEWKKHKDAPSIRNAAYALGKLQGGYSMALDATQVPKDLRDKCNTVLMTWEELVF